MKFFDTFSGYGGFHLGIERAYEANRKKETREHSSAERNSENTKGRTGKWERPICIGWSEVDKYASQVYKHKFGGKNYGDITKIKADELPDFDLFTGGFPCQAFSIAGKRKGFDDTRGTLFFDIARICKEKRPKHILLENVKGLLSHDSGRTFETILGVLSDLGYSVEWQVLNSKNFGVPQNRERVFIIGHLRGFGGRQVFPIEGANREADSTKVLSKPISNCLRTNYSNGKSNETYIRPVLTPDRPEKRQNGRRMKEDGEPMFTLTGQDKHGVFDGMKIRRLSPRECERLQGLPDDWTKEGSEGLISDTQRYKLCGNGVTVNVVEEVIKRLFKSNVIKEMR